MTGQPIPGVGYVGPTDYLVYEDTCGDCGKTITVKTDRVFEPGGRVCRPCGIAMHNALIEERVSRPMGRIRERENARVVRVPQRTGLPV